MSEVSLQGSDRLERHAHDALNFDDVFQGTSAR